MSRSRQLDKPTGREVIDLIAVGFSNKESRPSREPFHALSASQNVVLADSREDGLGDVREGGDVDTWF
jgi:hypothetical protein